LILRAASGSQDGCSLIRFEIGWLLRLSIRDEPSPEEGMEDPEERDPMPSHRSLSSLSG
jgi:hypothetical protein